MKVNVETGSFKRRPAPAPAAGYRITLWIVAQVALTLVLGVGICNAYIYLNQRIAETEAAIALSQKTVHLAEREIDQLRIQGERLASWPHIRSQIERHRLGLRQPVPGQVRKLVFRVAVPTRGNRIAIRR